MAKEMTDIVGMVVRGYFLSVFHVAYLKIWHECNLKLRKSICDGNAMKGERLQQCAGDLRWSVNGRFLALVRYMHTSRWLTDCCVARSLTWWYAYKERSVKSQIAPRRSLANSLTCPGRDRGCLSVVHIVCLVQVQILGVMPQSLYLATRGERRLFRL